MSRLDEGVAKELLRSLGLLMPAGEVVSSPADAARVASQLGSPVVVKALIPTGKRGKAGGIKKAATPHEAEVAAKSLLGTTLRNYPVERVLVEQQVDIVQELYAALLFDPALKQAVALLSASGGVEVEELVRRAPGALAKVPVDPWTGLLPYMARDAWVDIGLSGKVARNAADALVAMWRGFERYDATLLEVNPLALTADGQVVAAGVLMSLDDDSLHRHPELEGRVVPGNDRTWRPLTERERLAMAADQSDPYRGTARYTELDEGDLCFLCGGGGGSLLMMDALIRMGARPANYTEMSGNPPEEKVFQFYKAALTKPGIRGVIRCGNISSNSQTDVIARGFVRAVQAVGLDPKQIPIVVRSAGVHQDEARRIYESAGIEYYADEISMEDAAAIIVQRLGEANGTAGEVN